MGTLQVTLFGRFDAKHGEESLTTHISEKAQQLFGYLLLRRRQSHPREALASMLWEYCTTSRSRAYLRRALWQLQKALDEVSEEQPVLQVEQEWMQINPEARLWVDVTTFEETYQKARGVPGSALGQKMADDLREAVHLYTDALLVNWYEEWCLFERERLQDLYLIMLDKLVEYSIARRQYEKGLDYVNQVMRIDGLRERTHYNLMRLLYLDGNRTGALRQYEHCVEVLEEGLGVKPSQTTVALYEQIRADEKKTVLRGTLPGYPPADEEPALVYDRLDHIMSLQQVIEATQAYIRQEMEVIERSLQQKK